MLKLRIPSRFVDIDTRALLNALPLGFVALVAFCVLIAGARGEENAAEVTSIIVSLDLQKSLISWLLRSGARKATVVIVGIILLGNYAGRVVALP